MGTYYTIEGSLRAKNIKDVNKKVDDIRKDFCLTDCEIYLSKDRALDIALDISFSGEAGFSFVEDLAVSVAKVADGDLYVTNEDDASNTGKYIYTLSDGKASFVGGTSTTYYHGRINEFANDLKSFLSADERRKLAEKLLS